MGIQVVNGAMLQCAMGTAPSTLTVLQVNRVTASKQPAANIMDNKPFVNIAPFATCMSLSNPATASLTAAALGVLTPGPCTPMTSAPWAPGAAQTTVAKMPALTDSSTCVCSFGGVIQITVPGQFTVMVS